jgi:hypothetical protein
MAGSFERLSDVIAGPSWGNCTSPTIQVSVSASNCTSGFTEPWDPRFDTTVYGNYPIDFEVFSPPLGDPHRWFVRAKFLEWREATPSVTELHNLLVRIWLALLSASETQQAIERVRHGSPAPRAPPQSAPSKR